MPLVVAVANFEVLEMQKIIFHEHISRIVADFALTFPQTVAMLESYKYLDVNTEL